MNKVAERKTQHLITRAQWAQYLSKAGFTVMPIKGGTKKTYQPWAKWEAQCEEMVRKHWKENPDDDIAVLTKGMYAVDCDHPASQVALTSIKAKHGIQPSVIVRTLKGVHEWYALPEGVTARQVGHDTNEHPERIDIRTGNAYIIAPGSTDKKVVTWDLETRADLTPVTQAFVDEIERHNGMTKSREVEGSAEKSAPLGDAAVPRIKELLEYISPDVGHSDWVRVGMAIYRETEGSDAGLDLFDTWSKQGLKYKGVQDILTRWKSFNKEVRNPVTMGTLIHMARAAGAPVGRSGTAGDAWFEMAMEEAPSLLSPPVEEESQTETVAAPEWKDRFEQASVTHHRHELAKEIQEARPFFGGLALLGQTTVIYAAPNTGKTLLTMKLIIDSVERGDVDPANVIYINLDDSSAGLYDKAVLLNKHGITKVLANGYFGFTVDKFRPWIEEEIAHDKVKGRIIIVDTMTRVFDTNHKGQARSFTQLAAALTAKGGTLIALGHTRKNPGPDGKEKYGGVSDVFNDFQGSLMLETVGATRELKTVVFKNEKRRGAVKFEAAFSYSNVPTENYEELLSTVKPADSAEVAALSLQTEIKQDSRLINIIQSQIRMGVKTKKALTTQVMKAGNVSRKKVEALLAKYAGTNSRIHFWSITKGGDRGAHMYELLPEHERSAPVSQVPSAPTAQPAPGQGQPDSFMPYPEESDPQYVDADSSELEDVTF